MRKHLISILTVLLFFIPLISSYSDEGSSIVSEYFSGINKIDKSLLEKEGKITLFLEKKQSPVYLPDIPERDELQKIIEKSSFNTGIETVFIHREKQYIKKIEDYFKVLTDIKTLEGIEYYSHSREKYRTLFEEAYPVVGTDKKKKAEVPVFDENKKNYSFNCFIKDLSFGKNFYALDYKVSDNYLIMKMTNIDSMKYGLIPVIGQENLTFYLIIMTDGDELAIYCSGICDHFNAGFLKNKIKNSIHSRVEALYAWFIDNIPE